MGLISTLRKVYISTTNLTHGYQEQPEKQANLYRLWSPLYDLSLKLDSGYAAGIRQMVDAVVRDNDTVLDIGCGTGLATIYAANRARRVTGIDPSSEMLAKLRGKIEKQQIANIELIPGFFPDALAATAVFNTAISSFAIVHIPKDGRLAIYQAIYNCLQGNGRLGTFSAQGEIAPAFETKNEVQQNLESAGFEAIQLTDVHDIYRVVTAVKKNDND